MHRLSRAPELGGALALAVLTGCQCGSDRPYTPFKIEPSAEASAHPPPPPSGVVPTPPDVYPREAVAAPSDVSKFTVDGVPIDVGPTRVVDRALAADFDGDGTKDAVAWTRAKTELPETADTGELVFFGGKTPAGRVVSTAPPFVPSGPGCKKGVALAQTGPHTVALDVWAHCDAALLPRAPTRGLSVIAPAADRTGIVSLRLAEPARGETLKLSVDSRDRDGDGRDDVRVTVSLASDPNEPPATADLVWLDRAAGPSRDRSEPARSLGMLATPEGRKQAVPGKHPLHVFDDARRLHGTLCAESGTARIFDADGEALPCADVGATLAALLEAEVRLALEQKDPLSAASALSRDGWYGGPLPGKARASLEKAVTQASERHTTTELVLDVAARSATGLPRFSPLSFDTDGSLLVLGTEGVSRASLPAGQLSDASSSIDPWPLTVGGTDGAPRWTGVAFPCDVSEVSLLLSDAAGTPLPPRKTSILSPRPGPCKPGGPAPAPDLVPLEWTGGKNAGLVAGALFGVESLKELAPVPTAKGTPRSPDGKWFVLPWSQGFLVLGGAKPQTWSATTLALSDCTIANGAAAVACVRTDKVVVFTPSAAAEKKKGKTR